MSRITFVENRGKTEFWAVIAKELEKRGHQISWIVQNPLEKPALRNQKSVVLSFPKALNLEDGSVPTAVAGERGQMYFRSGIRHYNHYQKEIEKALNVLMPEVVIGESTLFHELLVIASCQVKGIRYFHPAGARYPSGRMMIFDGNTQTPITGSGEVWDDGKLKRLIDALRSGAIMPDYMRVPNRFQRAVRNARLQRRKIRVVVGNLIGERYNTPSLLQKISLSLTLRKNLRLWKSISRVPERAISRTTTVLYPLQMQPEANIDVWGRPFNNQVEVIVRCLSAMPENGRLAVKANPKAKCELSNDLLDLAKHDRRVVLLPLDMSMAEAQEITLGTITVTGTVGYEAVFGRGRCISVRHPLIAELFPLLHADTPEDAVKMLFSTSSAGQGTPEMARSFLQRLISTSFLGVINEPSLDPSCVEAVNIIRVSNAIEQAIDVSGEHSDLMSGPKNFGKIGRPVNRGLQFKG